MISLSTRALAGPPSPVVIVHHNYAGLKTFDVAQASFLARCGYVGLAVDLYEEVHHEGAEAARYSYADREMNGGTRLGRDALLAEARKVQCPAAVAEGFYDYFEDESKTADWQLIKHWSGACELMNGLYLHPARWRRLMRAYLDEAFAHPAVARGKAGCIGYCLGGQSCLEMLRDGQAVQAVCTFHGLLHSRPMRPDNPYATRNKMSEDEYRVSGFPGYWDAADAPSNAYTAGCKVLVEHGELDHEVPPEDVAAFALEMSAAGVDWRVETHGGGKHGFALGRGCVGSDYQEATDRRSTLAMLALFSEVWPEHPQFAVPSNASGTVLPPRDAVPAVVEARPVRSGVLRAASAGAVAALVGVAAWRVLSVRR